MFICCLMYCSCLEKCSTGQQRDGKTFLIHYLKCALTRRCKKTLLTCLFFFFFLHGQVTRLWMATVKRSMCASFSLSFFWDMISTSDTWRLSTSSVPTSIQRNRLWVCYHSLSFTQIYLMDQVFPPNFLWWLYLCLSCSHSGLPVYLGAGELEQWSDSTDQ